MHRRQFHRKVKQRRGIREDGKVILHVAKPVSHDVDCVQAGRHGIHLKTSFSIRGGLLFPIGLLCLQHNSRVLNGPVLRIVNDAANSAEDSGQGDSLKN